MTQQVERHFTQNIGIQGGIARSQAALVLAEGHVELPIMHNEFLPFVDCMFTIIFYYSREGAITMTSVRPEWLPNANTYADVLQYVGRIQHRVY